MPEWWSEELRERVANEAAAVVIHMGSHGPDLDTDYIQPVLGPSGLYFRTEDDVVFAHRNGMAFRWRWGDDGDVRVDGFVLGRRVAGADVPKHAVPPERGTAFWN